MNQTIETILQHRSIRKFTSEPINERQCHTILDCAIAASSSSFIQCVSIIRVTDHEKRLLLAQYAGGQEYVASAAEFFVFCADYNRHQQIYPEAKLGFSEQTLIGAVDAALMAQNSLLAAESLGLGGVYIGGLRNNPDNVSSLLSLPKHVLPLFGLCLGHPAQSPEIKPRLPRSLVVHENSYAPLNREILACYDQHVRKYYQHRSGGSKDMSWSEQISGTLNKEARPFMKQFIEGQGFSLK